jgi:acyl dehydratase
VPLLTDAVKAFIGTEAHYPAREELGRASIRYFALALGDDDPLYVDDDYAKQAGHPSVIAPSTLICETCQYAHRSPDPNGYIGHEWHLPLGECRILRAGNDYEFFRPVLPSDRISATWKMVDIVERNSSRGGSQLFVTTLVTYRDAADEIVATNRETMVYQPLEAA